MQYVDKYKINLHWLDNRPVKLVLDSFFCMFLKPVQTNFIFSDNITLLYIYFFVKYQYFTGIYAINVVYLKEEELRSKLSVLSELENEKSSREELEQLNTTWSEQNVKISEELNKAKVCFLYSTIKSSVLGLGLRL